MSSINVPIPNELDTILEVRICTRCGEEKLLIEENFGLKLISPCQQCRKKILLSKFENNFEVGSVDECWIWQGRRSIGGYGILTMNRKLIWAHRMSYEINIGSILHGLFVLHHCDNPPCVNPQHLFIGTIQDNSLDMVRKNRHRKDYTNQQGELGSRAKLTAKQVTMARRYVARGMSVVEAAKKLRVSAHIVALRQAVIGVSWKNCPEPPTKSIIQDTLERRFWAKVVKCEKGCWAWRGGVDSHGYGQIVTERQKRIGAHRFAWILNSEAIPANQCVLQTCGNKLCCNPAHLFLGPANPQARSANDQSAHGGTGR